MSELFKAELKNRKLVLDNGMVFLLSGYTKYMLDAGYYWSYDWYFHGTVDNRQAILTYSSSSNGTGWFLSFLSEEINKSPEELLGKYYFPHINVQPIDHDAIDAVLGNRPRHCQGY